MQIHGYMWHSSKMWVDRVQGPYQWSAATEGYFLEFQDCFRKGKGTCSKNDNYKSLYS